MKLFSVRRLAVVTVFLLPTLMFCADKRHEADLLLGKASELSSLSGAGVRPFHLYINLKLGGLVSGRIDGRYMWTSVPGEHWRRETRFADYSEVEIGGPGRFWMKRSLDFRPKSATWVQRLIGNYSHLMVFPDEKVSRVYNDSHARCIELRGGDEQRALCFEASGLLRSVQLQAENTTYQYSDYMKFGEKWFPKTLRVTARNRLVVDAKLDELASEDAPYPGLFVPPAGAREGEGCQSPVPARLIEKVHPSYPPLARQERRSGTVTLYARIANDGTVQDLRVIETAGRDLDDAALSAVKQWKYAPFMCGDHPVALETNITVIFSLPNR